MSRKCLICNKIIEDTELGDNKKVIPYKGRWAHADCFNHIMGGYTRLEQAATKQKETEKKQAKKEAEEKKIKPVEVENEGLSEKEYACKRRYYAYLREQLGDIQSKHYAITDRLMKKYDYTFSGMLNTLVYMHDVLEKEFNDETGNIVALIPYYYEEADTYYVDLEKCERANENKDISKMYQTRTIKVKKDSKKRRGKALEF